MAASFALAQHLPDAVEGSWGPGDYLLVWYDEDVVWHKRLYLWKHGAAWQVFTPDGDKYLECLRRVGNGPSRVIVLPDNGDVPSSITEPVCRFESYPSEA